jgi:hypothetical protein
MSENKINNVAFRPWWSLGRRVDLLVGTNVSEERTASIFNPEDDIGIFLFRKPSLPKNLFSDSLDLRGITKRLPLTKLGPISDR